MADLPTNEIPLHEMLSTYRIVDWRVVQRRLTHQPQEAKTLDPNGISTLQHALARPSSSYLPEPIIESMLQLHPEAVWLGIESKTSPLHLLCRHNPSLPLIQMMVQRRPYIAPQDDQAVLYLWEFYCAMFGEAGLTEFLCEGSREALRIYLQFLALIEGGHRMRQFSNGLHTVASLTTEPSLLRLAIQAFPDQISQPDNTQQGRLPLHNLVTSTIDKRPMQMGCMSMRVFDMQPLYQVLYDAFPEALSIPDSQGQLPLHCAVKSGMFDELGRSMIQQYPAALEVCDSQGWRPFHVAALSPRASLTSLYTVLREDPRVLFLPSTRMDSSNQIDMDEEFHNEHAPGDVHGSYNDEVWQLVETVGAAGDSRAWSAMTDLLKLPSRMQVPAPHRFAGMEFCPGAILKVQLVYGERRAFQRQCQSKGRLPLHYVAAVAKQEEDRLISQGDADERCPYLDRLQFFLEEFPEACRVRDKHGQLPIHLMAKSGASVSGLEPLVAAWPDCLYQRDGIEFVPPVLLGAHAMSLNEIYFLMHAAPDAISACRESSSTSHTS